jgi:hypothetical protein
MLEELNLQKIVLIMAVVAFMFAVIVIYYRSLPTGKNIKWPPVTTQCPDYWDLSSDGNRCVNTSGMNKGKLDYATCNASQNNYPCCEEGTCYILQTSTDNKKRWAKKNGFVWDGIYSG